ncbi:streptophobe family protein [Actinomadura violacea]|uniref:Integral membrane protein n=1 Tax=Actinomadura violacea TaxID=2819934 RepID=A0ABS3S8U1_9ACTN|nr:streptophobe family protein [Actinomadura violacea]MBO2465417.1 hypothetical protein [Actinomadura violacea]
MAARHETSAAPDSLRGCATWRHMTEGVLAAAGALAAMALTAAAAITAMGDPIAPLTRLVPTLVSMAVGGRVTLTGGSGGDPGGAAGMLGGLGLGGASGGMSLGAAGHVAAVPLMLTFVGTVVLGILFFRPLRRRVRATAGQFTARVAGTLLACAFAVPVVASLAHGTAQLPHALTERMGKGGSGRGLGGGGLGKLLGGGGGGGGALSKVDFHTDIVMTTLLGLGWAMAVIAIGCLVARRTRLPRPIEQSRARRCWNPVASALTGVSTALCSLLLFTGLLAAGAAWAGREQAGKAAGGLLLAGPNLLGVLLTSGVGEPWQAGVHREQGQAGGMMGMLGGMGGMGGGSGADGGGGDRMISLPGWSGSGVPLWLIGLLLLTAMLLVAGYLAAGRAPARSLRQDVQAMVGRHMESGLRAAAIVCGSALVMCFLARGTLQIGFRVMGTEMGGMKAALDGAVGISALGAPCAAVLAVCAGSLLQGRRARRRTRRAGHGTGAARRSPRGEKALAGPPARR